MLPQANKWNHGGRKGISELVSELKSITVYPCPYCNRLHKTVKGAVNHQAQCYRNPARRACVTCSRFNNFNFEHSRSCDCGYDVIDGITGERDIQHDCDGWRRGDTLKNEVKHE